MRISRVVIHNFKCIRDLSINFEEITGLWEIEGVVGAGKTTIGEAILFSLFGRLGDKPNSSLVTWGESTSKLEMWCSSSNHDIYIQRTISKTYPSTMKVYIDNEYMTSTNKRDIQKRLEQEYYDIPKLMVESLCILSFNGFKSLSSMNTNEVSKFLDQVFGLKIVTEYADKCNKLRLSESSEVKRLNTQLSTQDRQLREYKDFIEHDKVDTTKLDDLQQQKHNIENGLRELNTKQKIKELMEKRNSELQPLQKQQVETTVLGKKVRKDIEMIKKGICPTCGQEISGDHLSEYETNLNNLLSTYKDLQVKIEAIEKSYKELIDDIELKDENLRTELRRVDTEISKIDNYISQQKRFSTLTSTLQHNYDETKNNLEVVSKSLSLSEQLYNILTHDTRYRVIRTITPLINQRMLKYMVELGQPYTIELDEEFNCIVHSNSTAENIPISSLSTGQLKTVDMVIILSILDVLLSRVNFNIIFLDELLSNMHEDLRDSMCEILRREVSRNRTVFLISHTKLNNMYLDGHIHVENMDGSASYEVVNT